MAGDNNHPQRAAVRGENPKDRIASKKVDLSLLPDIASFQGACAMMDGARKYGPYNWRDNAVLARVYIAAAKRHLAYWAAGEESAKDSGVHHLGHAIACLAILLDAQATGNLSDDRAKSPELIAAMDALNEIVKDAGVDLKVNTAAPAAVTRQVGYASAASAADVVELARECGMRHVPRTF